MIFERMDHISLAVKDYDAAHDFFTRVLGAVPGACGRDEKLKYFFRVFSLGDLTRLELIHATGPGSFLDGFLASRGSGAHHITIQTPDLAAARERLEEFGVPFFGYNDHGEAWKELFIHPRHAFGLLIQIAQFNPDDWLPENRQGRALGAPPWRVDPMEEGLRLTLAHPGGGTVSVELDRQGARELAATLEKAAR